MKTAAFRLAVIAGLFSAGTALAGPGGAGHGHGDETAYGKPGDAKKPARIVQVVMSERDGKMVIPERLTQKELAARVGASREMINRILRDLTTGGYVSIEDGHITIDKTPPARW